MKVHTLVYRNVEYFAAGDNRRTIWYITCSGVAAHLQGNVSMLLFSGCDGKMCYKLLKKGNGIPCGLK